MTTPAFVCSQCRDPKTGRPVPLAVIATRHPARCFTRRYRECPGCGRTLTTVERPEPVTPEHAGAQQTSA